MRLEDSYLFAVNSLSRIIGQQLDIRLLDYGVTHQQVFTLMALDENHGIHISDLAKVLLTNRTTVHKNLKRLKGKEYISYVQARDKNNRLLSKIYLTDKGKALLNSLVISLDQWDDAFMYTARDSLTPQITYINGIYVRNFLTNLHYTGLWKEKES